MPLLPLADVSKPNSHRVPLSSTFSQRVLSSVRTQRIEDDESQYEERRSQASQRSQEKKKGGRKRSHSKTSSRKTSKQIEQESPGSKSGDVIEALDQTHELSALNSCGDHPAFGSCDNDDDLYNRLNENGFSFDDVDDVLATPKELRSYTPRRLDAKYGGETLCDRRVSNVSKMSDELERNSANKVSYEDQENIGLLGRVVLNEETSVASAEPQKRSATRKKRSGCRSSKNKATMVEADAEDLEEYLNELDNALISSKGKFASLMSSAILDDSLIDGLDSPLL